MQGGCSKHLQVNKQSEAVHWHNSYITAITIAFVADAGPGRVAIYSFFKLVKFLKGQLLFQAPAAKHLLLCFVSFLLKEGWPATTTNLNQEVFCMAGPFSFQQV